MQLKHLFCHVLIASWFIRGGRSQQATHANPPWTETAGDYLIYSCGAETDKVRALVDQTRSFLQEAVASTQSTAVLGNNAYKAFFGDADPNSVKKVLSKIIVGAEVSFQNVPYHPTIVCVNEERPGLKEQMEVCRMHKGRGKAMYSGNSQFVYLCPGFLTWRTRPVLHDCGTVVAGRTQLQNSKIEYTQYTILVRELVSMYLGASTLRPGVYDVNHVMGLGSTTSIVNPSSYAFYVGSVLAGCSDFPTKHYRSGGRRPTEDNSRFFSEEIFEPHVDCASNPIYVAFGMCTKTGQGNSHH